MSQHAFPETTISAALSHAINQVPDDGLKLKVDILVAKTARALAAARSINFVGYEDRELADHSLELWNELAPRFGAVFKELNALVDAALELFPKEGDGSGSISQDFDLAFDLLAPGETHPVTGKVQKPTSPHAKVTELVQSYAWVLRRDIQAETRKLREPALMQQQVNLLGELEAFRDKMVGAMHAMVGAVLNVFEDVEVEALYPQANEWVEMGVALRRQVADLARQVEQHVAHINEGMALDDEVRGMLALDDQRTAQILKLPSATCLRAADRHEMATFRRSAARLRQQGAFNLVQARQLLDGYGTFLASLQAVELMERLRGHDVDVAQEAQAFLRRAQEVVEAQPEQGMLFLTHAGRRIARLYGVSPALDAAARDLREMAGKAVGVDELKAVMEQMTTAVAPLVEQR